MGWPCSALRSSWPFLLLSVAFSGLALATPACDAATLTCHDQERIGVPGVCVGPLGACEVIHNFHSNIKNLATASPDGVVVDHESMAFTTPRVEVLV